MLMKLEHALNVVTDVPNVAVKMLVPNAKVDYSLRMANARLVDLVVLHAPQKPLAILAKTQIARNVIPVVAKPVKKVWD